MKIVTWKSEIHAVGIPEMDQQHQHLFDLLNKLFDQLSKRNNKTIVQEILTELIDYSYYHFNMEENHFCCLKSYHHCDHHCLQHQEFIQNIRKFHDDFLSGKKMLNMDIFVFLKDWINQHIRQVDRGYRDAVLKNH